MPVYPPRGLRDWDDDLQRYIDGDQIRIPATRMRPVSGTATHLNGYPSIQQSATTDNVATMVVGVLPPTWNEYHLDVGFLVPDTAAGDIVFVSQVAWSNPSAPAVVNLLAATPSSTPISAPGVASRPKYARLRSTLPVLAGQQLLIAITRDADSAPDTYASASHLIEMILTKAS